MDIRLLVLDLDGTLLRPGGGIDPRDEAAVRRAQEQGVTVTIATGRIASGTLPIARALGMTSPVVCAEGALIMEPTSGQVLERHAMTAGAVEGFTATLRAHGAQTYWLTDDEIHGEEGDGTHLGYIGSWSPRVHLHASLAGSPAWSQRAALAMALGVGPRDAIEAAHARVEEQHGAELFAVRFPVLRADAWSLLARRTGVDKGSGVARVAGMLGVARSQVAVVGDWLNDVPMFRWAARAFVMGQAPEHIAAHASDRLTATHVTGGGVAEAVRRILGG